MKSVLLFLLLFIYSFSYSQEKKTFTHADTLRGSLNANRTWWDVLRYDISVTPDYNNKTITASNTITYKVVAKSYPAFMQIDLQQPLIVDSILFNHHRSLPFTQEENVCLVNAPKQVYNSKAEVTIYYHGKPREAKRAPWDGGWIWTKDSLGRPWMSVACQGLGASVWYPCKDHQSDEPDSGASLTITVADSLVAVGNGRLTQKKKNTDSTTSYTWSVVNPINNYLIIPYIGKYVNIPDGYTGEKGKLDINYWVLDYNEQRAKEHMMPEAHRMLKAFEYWMGPYPFYEDSYKLVDAPHLGMEHQSAVAYGNKYGNGYLGRDLSKSGWGLKWDFIIVHESGHEWFANNVTSKDLADMWIHESFTNYSETLFTEYYYGKKAGNEYNAGSRVGVKNDAPVIPPYGVNAEGSGDMYPKGGNMLHTIRHSINDDEKFRAIWRGLNKTFYHKTVTAKQVEDYISSKAGFDYSKIFQQYLTTTQVPSFEFYFDSTIPSKVFYRYSNCVTSFNLPLTLKDSAGSAIKIYPTSTWKNTKVSKQQASLFSKESIEAMYFLNVAEGK